MNIESLTVSESALPGIHKFTIVVYTEPDQIEKLVKQIEKKVDVSQSFRLHSGRSGTARNCPV